MRILYIDIDSLRPDHMGSGGYHRNTTPNLDRIAKEGVVFERYYCTTSPCMPSRATFASGLFACHHGIINHDSDQVFRHTGDPSRPMMIRHLRENGFKTVTFSSFADRHDAFWFLAGWDEVIVPTQKKGAENADEMIDPLIGWLRANARDENLFLHLQLWDPHRNYTMPIEYKAMMSDQPLPEWPDDRAIADHQNSFAPFGAATLHPLDYIPASPAMPAAITDRADFRSYVDGYDGAVRFMDDQLGKLFVAMEDLRILHDTAIIVSADHGEAMGEHGVYGDHTCADEAVHHIPLIVRWPWKTPPKSRFGGLVCNVDLQPTICDLAGIDTPPGWDGISFRNVIDGQGTDYPGRDYLVFEHALYSVGRSVRTHDWLLMRTYHPGVMPLDPVELYEISSDPHMTRNLAEERPEKVSELDHLMAQWWHEQNTASRDDIDRLPEAIRRGPFHVISQRQWSDYLMSIGRDDLDLRYGESLARPFRQT